MSKANHAKKNEDMEVIQTDNKDIILEKLSMLEIKQRKLDEKLQMLNKKIKIMDK